MALCCHRGCFYFHIQRLGSPGSFSVALQGEGEVAASPLTSSYNIRKTPSTSAGGDRLTSPGMRTPSANTGTRDRVRTSRKLAWVFPPTADKEAALLC